MNGGMLMGEFQNYDSAVEVIKTAVLQSQYDAARSVNEKQLISFNYDPDYNHYFDRIVQTRIAIPDIYV